MRFPLRCNISELAIIGEIGSFHNAPFRVSIRFVSPEAMRAIVGNLSQNLKIMERIFQVALHQSGEQLAILGEKEPVRLCARAIEQLLKLMEKGRSFRPADIDQMCRLLKREPDTEFSDLQKECIFVGKSKKIYPRSIRQKTYFKAIQSNDLVFGVGPAGTGKTYLAMAMALDALHKETVKKIVLCRPAVEAGEKLGFLPGDMLEKVNPYLRPLYDALYDLVGFEKGTRYIERNIIEVAPLAFMRGRTLANSFVILDEAQNTTPEQIKMFLTRFGMGSKVVVNGDPSQVDLPNKQPSGLRHALKILSRIKGVQVIELTDADVVRHPLVSAIIRAYSKAGE